MFLEGRGCGRKMNVVFVFDRHVHSALQGSGRAAGGGLVNIGHGGACPGKVGGTGLGVLGVVVGDGGLDGILSEHGAVHCKQQS